MNRGAIRVQAQPGLKGGSAAEPARKRIVIKTKHPSSARGSRAGRFGFALLALVAALAFPAVLTGCSSHQASAAAPPATGLFVVCLDRSNSMDALRADQLNQLDLVATAAMADNVPLDIWVFDKSPERVWGPRIPYTRSDLLPVKSEEMTTGTPRRMTRPALLLEALADEANIQSAHNPTFILLTDGDQEVWQDQPVLRKGADRLGAISGSRIGVFGIHPENRKAWEAALTPGFSTRYSLAGPSEVNAAILQMVN